MHNKKDEKKILGVDEQSCFTEIGNIINSCYLSAISNFLNISIIPTAPKLIIDINGTIFKQVLDKDLHKKDKIFIFENEFIGNNVKGYFIFVPNLNAIDVLMKKQE
jgi:chemotaxis protein CheY-P-specific phosphatase CheC